MLIRRMMYFLTIFQIVSGNGESIRRNSFLMKLVNRILPKSHEYAAVSASQDIGCSYECVPPTALMPRSSAFGPANATADDEQSESQPSAKFSIFNLLSDDEEPEDEDSDYGTDDKTKEEEEEEEEDDDIDFFGSEDEIKSDEPEGAKDESFLKQYHRKNHHLHSFVFPLLMAYKLKFFTVIPLLLGTLVLLVGTTGIAGFFFALFAAALGIHVKSHNH